VTVRTSGRFSRSQRGHPAIAATRGEAGIPALGLQDIPDTGVPDIPVTAVQVTVVTAGLDTAAIPGCQVIVDIAVPGYLDILGIQA